MAKKSVALRTKANSATKTQPEKRLSFDGGSIHIGGYGNWHPAPLTQAELWEAATDEGERVDVDAARYAAGCKVGQKAAAEFVEYIRNLGGNFSDDEDGGDLASIAIDMLSGPNRARSPDEDRRRAEAIGFFCELFPYLAFGARTVTQADKDKPEIRF